MTRSCPVCGTVLPERERYCPACQRGLDASPYTAYLKGAGDERFVLTCPDAYAGRHPEAVLSWATTRPPCGTTSGPPRSTGSKATPTRSKQSSMPSTGCRPVRPYHEDTHCPAPGSGHRWAAERGDGGGVPAGARFPPGQGQANAFKEGIAWCLADISGRRARPAATA